MVRKREAETLHIGSKSAQICNDIGMVRVPFFESSLLTIMSLYPIITAFKRELLAVSTVHTLSIRQYGNPTGIPLVFLHGGNLSPNLIPLPIVLTTHARQDQAEAVPIPTHANSTPLCTVSSSSINAVPVSPLPLPLSSTTPPHTSSPISNSFALTSPSPNLGTYSVEVGEVLSP